MRIVVGTCVIVTASAVLLSAAPAAADYFFDSAAGSDANPGTSPDAPLQSLKKLASLELKPGDTVRFKRGGEWRGQLAFKGNGARGRPIRLTAYGTGPRPEFLGSRRFSDWQLHEGQVYKLKVPRNQIIGDKEINAVFVCPPGRVPTVIGARRSGLPSKPGQCAYDQDAETLYLITPDGKPPAEHVLEVPVLSPTLHLQDRSWLEIDGLSFAFGNRTQVQFRKCRDVLFKDCAVVFMGGKNPNVLVTEWCERLHIADCFVYWSANNGIKLNRGSTNCRITGCTIVKLLSNDGICVHDLGESECGPRIIVEDNVIGQCPENSLDITSGDYHEFRRNICYMDAQGIITGHSADHILIEHNISFDNKREGIKIGTNPDEGGRGHIRVIGNLVYDNDYPGIGVEANDTKVYNNTVVNSKKRSAVRLSKGAVGSEVVNNLIVTLDPKTYHASLEFLQGDPVTWKVKVANNMFFHVARPDGKVIHSKQGSFTPAEFSAKYRTGMNSLVAKPRFTNLTDRLFVLAPGSPGIDMGVNLGLPFSGRAPDIGWTELGSNQRLPAYPPFLIGDGENDEAEILYLWGKSDTAPPKKDWTWPGANLDLGSLRREAGEAETAGDLVRALTNYNTVGFFGEGSEAGRAAQQRFEALLGREEAAAQFAAAELEYVIGMAEEYARIPGLAIHYADLARVLAADDPAALARIEPLHQKIAARLQDGAKGGK
ncbi:MAG: right-handed parallel beta-helix repeat-containing protein [Kiritimatiellae bacterium]|nr:right-handed parallel beta-helix repeat-containing protein [Kiritimatiellia bacterium]